MSLFSSYGKNVYDSNISELKSPAAVRASPIKKVVFGMLTAAEVRKFSVCEVFRPSQRNASGGDPVGTPYDRRMGVLESGHICETCGYDNKTCLGHFGHIDLPIPIYNIIFIEWTNRILQCVCVACARARILPENMKMMGIRGTGISRLRNIALRSEKYMRCPWEDCGKNLFSFRVEEQERITRYWTSTTKEVTSIDFSAGEALNVFLRMSNDVCAQLGLNYGLPNDSIHLESPSHGKINSLQFRPEGLIFTALPVIPPISRPYIIQDRKQHDDDLTEKYNCIAKECEKLSPHPNLKKPSQSAAHSKKEPLTETKRRKIEDSLRSHVWTLIYNKKDKSKVSAGGRPHKGLWERITGKDGRVQFNVRGKRVDFSARTVIIGGGTLIRADEIGVPEYIAKVLTVPCKVTRYNLSHCQSMVHDRKVNKIIRKGVTRNLSNMPDKGCKMRLFPGDIIEVHLYDGFPVVANRQPTLRLESMIGFKVRIIQDIAMRLPVCFTTGLNADFDGDEMNIHAPQSTGAKLEVAVMLRAANQILSPQRNAPVNGIVQDGLVGCYILTNIWEDTGKCTFVPVEDFYMCIDRSRIPRNRVDNLLRRARKWYPEYISPDYTLDLIAEIPGTLFLSILFPPDLKYEKVTDENEKYPIVKIEEGVILPDSGPVCKKVVGARAGSFLHEIAIRSPDMAIEFLTECQFMVDHWLYTHGFSIGISDLFLSGDADDTITQTLMETEAKIANILDRCPNGVPDDAAEQEINGLLNSTMNVGLRLSRQNMSKGDRNALNIMRKSGAKGNLTNLVQTTAFVGQQNVNGRRIQPMLTGRTRTLPYFEDYDNSSRARGFVGNGYRDGLDPIQMFFHAMGGRQGIIATAVGTAVTGYIQKRIGRKMEDNIIHEDCSVRINPSAKEEIIEDETDDQARDVVLKGGKIIQFLYGGDGFDSRKLCYAKGLTFPFFCNPASVAARMNNAYRQSTNTDYPERKLDTEEIELIVSYITVGFHNHIKKLPPPLKRATDNVRHALSKACKFVTIIEDCIPDFCEELRTIFEKSKCQVGDKVGLVASSSVSEPATQMMLDTFHLAGVGTSDRGGGVPRLDELIGATKSDKQKKTTGMLYLKNSEIDLITKEIIDLKKSGLNSAKLQKLREDRLRIATVLKKTYEEVKVSDLMRGSCIKYIKEYVNSEEFFSPVEKSLEEIADMVGCTEYKPEWWATSPLNSQNISTLGKHYQWWVVCLEFDVGKLYERRITLKDIGFIIETTHTELRCICSPDIMGRIDVFCDYTEPLETFMNASKDFFVASQDFTRPSYLTVNNAPYFLCRDVITSVIKMTRLAGMEGIKKAFVREDLEGGNVVIDVDLQPKSTVVSKKRYIAMLSDPNVDPSKTIVDDMHTIASVLGIEAARKMIIEEDTRIISFNGTYINPRHIQLLVDNMTYTGEITSVRRDGISRDVGPIAKVMFEQPVTNAITAAVGTEQDSMRSIASSIMMGTLSSGTGSVIVK